MVVVVGFEGIVDVLVGVLVFVWKGEMFEEYWVCIVCIFDWLLFGFDGFNLILDDGGDVIFFVYKGVEFEKVGVVFVVMDVDVYEFMVIFDFLCVLFVVFFDCWMKFVVGFIGVIEEIMIGVY